MENKELQHKQCHCTFVPEFIIKKISEHPEFAGRFEFEEQKGFAFAIREKRFKLQNLRERKEGLVSEIYPKVEIFDCKNSSDIKHAKKIANPNESTDTAVDEAFDGLTNVWKFWYKVRGRNSIDDNGMPLKGYVHNGVNHNNAFWNGEVMVFGDGDQEIFQRFTADLDVIGHELGHGIVQYSSRDGDLEYVSQSGALNEHFADVFGVSCQQWVNRANPLPTRWLLGDGIIAPYLHEYVKKHQGQTADALRSLAAPGTAYNNDILGKDRQPAHMRNYFKGRDDGFGVHINSGIPNFAFYTFVQSSEADAWDLPLNIWYNALTNLGSKATFFEARIATINAAEDAHKQGVREAWNIVGVDPKVIFFDIGGSLIKEDGNTAVILQSLKSQGIILGIIAKSKADESLGNLLSYFHPKLRIYSSVVGLSTTSTGIFNYALNKANTVTNGVASHAGKVVFVGDNTLECEAARTLGWGLAPDVTYFRDLEL